MTPQCGNSGNMENTISSSMEFIIRLLARAEGLVSSSDHHKPAGGKKAGSQNLNSGSFPYDTLLARGPSMHLGNCRSSSPCLWKMNVVPQGRPGWCFPGQVLRSTGCGWHRLLAGCSFTMQLNKHRNWVKDGTASGGHSRSPCVHGLV